MSFVVACGRFLGLSEEESSGTDLDVDASADDAAHQDSASGSTDGAPLLEDGAIGTPDAAPDSSKIDGGIDAGTINNPSCASKRSRADGGCDPAVFITKQSFVGSLPANLDAIGAEKGDNLCNEAKGTIPGAFRAWLSDGADGPATAKRFPKRSTRPYRNLNGALIADDFAQLITSGPKIAINVSETLEIVPPADPVWTGTLANGTPNAFRCTGNLVDWSSIANAVRGNYGFADPGNLSTWTNAGDTSCANGAHLYCFEQQD